MRKAPATAAACLLLALAGAGLVALWRAEKKPAPAPSPATPAAEQTAPPLHPVVRRIVEEGPAIPYLRFNHLIKEIPLDLAAHDIDALLAFISGPRPDAFRDGEWGSIVNDIEEALSVQNVPSRAVAEGLIAISRDPEKSRMLRDYAIQHIGGFAIHLVHTRHLRGPSEEFPAFDDLVAELFAAVRTPDEPWCGTALNVLDGLLRAAESRAVSVPGLTPDSLAAAALPIARDPSAPLNARLPALQAAARRGAPGVRDLALAILRDPQANIMLVQSAAAALALTGSREDLPFLEDLAARASVHTAPALRHAILSLSATP